MQKSNKKSLGFLTIVAFLMILVGIGYTVSSVFAVNPTQTSQSSQQPSSKTSSPSEEQPFSSLEKHVADTATSLRNQLLGTTNTANQSKQTEQLNQNTSDEHNSNIMVIDTVSARPLPTVYDDIETSPARESILVLYSNDLIQ
jgi:predicted lipid-binding transport protein (Tim44 family)